MNPFDLILDVNLARNRIAERPAGEIPPEDVETTLLHLDSARFHISRGDQTRAEYEYKIALNFVNTLIEAQQNKDIRCFKQKYFITLWAESMREELVRMFREHEAKFDADTDKRNGHWQAQLSLVRNHRKRFKLNVVLPDNADRVIVSTSHCQQPLFITESVNPNLDWVFRNVNRGLASMALHQSNLLNRRKYA